MNRPLNLLLLALLALTPVAAHAQARGRGGAGARGAQPSQPAPRGAQPQRGQRGGGGGQQGRRQTEIIVVPSYGYYSGSYVIGPYPGSSPLFQFSPFSEWPEPVVPSPFISASAASNRSNESALSAEIGRLSQEIEMLRAQTARPLPAPVAPPIAFQSPVRNAPNVPIVEAAPRLAPPPTPERIIPPTVLILRDGGRVEIQNYAIVGDLLWVLDEGKTQKVPLADIDREASEKENRGYGTKLPLAAK